jgi:hypothetical protein
MSTWSDAYRLALGNEPNGDRPWLGTLRLTAIYSRALSTSEVRDNYRAGPDEEGSSAGKMISSRTRTTPDELGGPTDDLRLEQNRPNPFNPTTTISYHLPEERPVRLEVYDLLGRRVRILVDRIQKAGRHTVRFRASDLPSGTYIYRLRAGSGQQIGRMTLSQ